MDIFLLDGGKVIRRASISGVFQAKRTLLQEPPLRLNILALRASLRVGDAAVIFLAVQLLSTSMEALNSSANEFSAFENLPFQSLSFAAPPCLLRFIIALIFIDKGEQIDKPFRVFLVVDFILAESGEFLHCRENFPIWKPPADSCLCKASS
jgi:hypothetical protein